MKPNYRKNLEKNIVKKNIDYSKIEKLKEKITSLLIENSLFWKSKEKKTQGIEKNIILRKLKEMDREVNLELFYLAISELIFENKVIVYESEGMTRYLYLDIPGI